MTHHHSRYFTATEILSRGLLALYFLILTWLVLFKLNFDFSKVFDHHHRSLNLVPFAAPSIVNGAINYGEMIWNCIFFIPFGLLLNLNFKRVGFLPKFIIILVFSLIVELLQYILAIGATDITDIITNTLGGFLGLTLYDVSNKYVNEQKLDRVIISVGALLLVLFLSMHISHLFFKHKN